MHFSIKSLRFASLWRTKSWGDSCAFKRLLKVYYRSVLAESFKTFIFQKFRRSLCHKVNLLSCVARRPLRHKLNLAGRPLCHKVNLQSCVARRPLCHKVNLPSCEAWRHRLIMTCDIFGTGQTNILGLCHLFGKTYKQPTVAPLKSLKLTHSTLLLHLLRRTIRYN